MPKCIAAVFAAAWNLIRALSDTLFSQPKGRHSAEQLRRRRSTRVRPYAPMTPADPTPLPSHPTVREQSEPREPSAPRDPRNPLDARPTGLKPPTAGIDADEVALVRPYLRAHETETEAARIQDHAKARLRAWGADLEFAPDSTFSFGPAPDGTRVYTLDEYTAPVAVPGSASVPAPEPAPEPEPGSDPADTFHVPAPRTPHPRVPARMDGLPHLSRIRARQQQRRSRTATLAGVGV